MQSKINPSLDEVCVLIQMVCTGQDASGNDVVSESEREIWCAEAPAGRADLTVAGQTGFSHDTLLLTQQDEYNGEEKARFNGCTLAIYRTYPREDGLIELYMGRKVGVGVV